MDKLGKFREIWKHILLTVTAYKFFKQLNNVINIRTSHFIDTHVFITSDIHYSSNMVQKIRVILQGPPSQTVVFYFVHVYTYIDWGYYLGIYSFQYPCTILAIKEFFLNFDSIYPIWGTFGSSPIFTILSNFHHIVDRINTFFWNNGQQNHQKRPNFKKRTVLES